MKRIVLSLGIAALALCINAQSNSGRVTYESVRKIEIKFGGEMAHLESMIPKEQKSLKELLFTESETLYRNIEKATDEEVVKEAMGNATFIQMRQANNVIHTDLSSKVKTELRDFMSRSFLIETKIDTLKWKLTGNSKQLLNHQCLEAEMIGSEKPVVAWFTPSIAVAGGPDGYSGLPGLILAVDINDGKTTITAQEVILNAVDPSQISKPKGGKKVSAQEFIRIVKEKTDEMKQGGGMIIMSK